VEVIGAFFTGSGLRKTGGPVWVAFAGTDAKLGRSSGGDASRAAAKHWPGGTRSRGGIEAAARVWMAS